MNKKIKKLPRLFVDVDLKESGQVQLGKEQMHYLCNVMRREVGDSARIFNGRDGEWLAEIIDVQKKCALLKCVECQQPQPKDIDEVHLFFAPIKKQRMEWLIEKAVELGATHLHPVLTQNTEVRKFKDERIAHQILEACEQCERLDLPTFSKAASLYDAVAHWDTAFLIEAAVERENLPMVAKGVDGSRAFLIGPEGGFTAEEVTWLLEHKNIKGVSLGARILRAETAGIFVLSQ